MYRYNKHWINLVCQFLWHAYVSIKHRLFEYDEVYSLLWTLTFGSKRFSSLVIKATVKNFTLTSQSNLARNRTGCYPAGKPSSKIKNFHLGILY